MKLYIVDSEIEQLTSIAGINEEIANKILEFVESDEFGELNDLEKVEGVGPELLTRISTLFSDLDPETMWLEDIVPRLIMATRTRPTKWHPWPKKKSKEENGEEEDGPEKPKKPKKPEEPEEDEVVPEGPYVRDDDRRVVLLPPVVGADWHSQLHTGEGYRFSVTIKGKNGKIVGVIISHPGGKGPFFKWPTKKKLKKDEEIRSVVKQDACVVITTNRRVITYNALEGKQQEILF
jgi:hypothetical protein